MLNISLMKIDLGGSQFEMKWGSLTAGSIVSFLPIIIFYTFLQQYFVRGVTGSAVKEWGGMYVFCRFKKCNKKMG